MNICKTYRLKIYLFQRPSNYHEWSMFQKFEYRRVLISIKISLALISQENKLAPVCTYFHCESGANAYCFTGDAVQINWLMFLKHCLSAKRNH